MKRICCIISLFVLCLTFNQAHAQRCLPGMKGLQVTGGMADGVHWNSKSDFAYYFGAAMSTYTKNGNRWVVGGEYLEKHYPYKDLQIPVSQFTGEGGYYLNFLSDRKKTFFLSLGLSALAGYETSNWGDKLLPDGSTLTDKDPERYCQQYAGRYCAYRRYLSKSGFQKRLLRLQSKKQCSHYHNVADCLSHRKHCGR